MNMKSVFLCSFLCFFSAKADVTLPAIFSDNMVLQAGMPVRVWGKAQPGEAVTVSITGNQAVSVSDRDGKWSVLLPEMPYCGSYDLKITGKNTIVLKNVLTGDLWICSGQSNMRLSMAKSLNAEKEIAIAVHPQLRLFNMEWHTSDKPCDNVRGRWAVCTPKSVAGFSAVAYFFGRELVKSRNIPIGLIHATKGGSTVRAWIDRETLESNPALESCRDWCLSQRQNARVNEPDYKMPSYLYNAMIAPIMPLNVKGVIWYQGESDVGMAHKYRNAFTVLISDWRSRWGQKDMPFLFVQLPNYSDPEKHAAFKDGWAVLREAQLLVSKDVANTAMAVTIDLGESNDIHPKNKEDVGKRLALTARMYVYHENIVCAGPAYEKMRIENNKIRLFFSSVGTGLKSASGTALTGFTVAGRDNVFHKAVACIEDDEVVVWSDKLSEPLNVRYAWANDPECSLYNNEGLPASPFRTDNLPLTAE